MSFVTYGEQNGRCRAGESGGRKRGSLPAAGSDPQRQPEKAGAEEDGNSQGNGHALDGKENGAGGYALSRCSSASSTSPG